MMERRSREQTGHKLFLVCFSHGLMDKILSFGHQNVGVHFVIFLLETVVNWIKMFKCLFAHPPLKFVPKNVIYVTTTQEKRDPQRFVPINAQFLASFRVLNPKKLVSESHAKLVIVNKWGQQANYHQIKTSVTIENLGHFHCFFPKIFELPDLWDSKVRSDQWISFTL